VKRGVIAMLAALGAASAMAQAPQSPSTAASAPSPADGRRAYTSFCVRCHGINLAVGSPAFFDLRTFPKDDKQRFVTSVTEGKRNMPAWGAIVTPEQLEAIWAYIGDVNGW
jgi:mono/diheme cytochrome c family protein